MARKKRQPPKRGPKQPPGPGPRRRAKAEPEPPVQLPDRRAMEGVMRGLLGNLFGPAPETPLTRAQEVVEQAFQETDPRKQARLARQALDISADCADAYILLAEQAATRKEALDLYQHALAAGERAIGVDAFQQSVGHFWGLLETRPYMRARERLAHTLWTLGRREEAVEHFHEMLRLNPNDNQGIRYTLASWLLDLGRDDALARLLDQYNERSATWAYSRILLAFRQHGDAPEARKRLTEARKVNKHVPAYLLGEQPIPPEPPSYYSPGEASEAIMYVRAALSAWRSTPGALTWLREAIAGKSKKAKAREPQAAGPTAAVTARLERLPQRFDIWQADWRRLGSVVEDEGGLVQPWMTLVTSTTSGLFLAQEMTMEQPSAAMIWDVLARAMTKPIMERPHRPTQVQVRPNPAWDELRPHLDEIGVVCALAGELDMIDALLDDLAKHLTKGEPPGLLDMPGMTPEQVGGFYHAAAEFYRLAPWKSLGYEEAIRIESERYESGPWFAVVMGQSGMTLGIALYEDLDLLRRLWAGDASDEENARKTVALTVTFDPEKDIPTADLLAAREHGWEVASPEAHPVAFKKEPGLSMRPPLAWELELLEGSLRAIPAFIARHKPGDTTPHPVTVPVASGELTLVLSWAEDV